MLYVYIKKVSYKKSEKNDQYNSVIIRRIGHHLRHLHCNYLDNENFVSAVQQQTTKTAHTRRIIRCHLFHNIYDVF